MFKSLRRLVVSLSLLLIVSFPVYSNDTSPVLNNGKKWRFAYYEGGHFSDYNKVLYWTMYGLMKRGWVEKGDIPLIINDNPEPLWKWLTDDMRSRYIEFPKDAFYSAEWNDSTRATVKTALLDRLNRKG